MFRILPFGLSLFLFAIGCGVEEVVMEPFRGATPHERYLESLERAGLGTSNLARRWAEAAEDAVQFPVDPALPFREEGRFLAGEPLGLGYRFELRRGQRLQVVLERQPVDAEALAGEVFVELFRLRDPAQERSPLGNPLPVAWTDPPSDTLVYEARASATYLLRIQPELFEEGTFVLEVRTGASMAFPVEDRGTGQIGSRFGVARDGGRRSHHGVDIFAPRGTPVLAAGPGVVTRVQNTPIGGLVVWVRDEERGLSRYYAHLDRQDVAEGNVVRAGDPIGTVGNTGNARTTPPHLHFGIYVRGEGPVDPWDFLFRPTATPRALLVDRERFTGWARLRDPGLAFRTGPGNSPLPLGMEPAEVRVLAGTGPWYRIRLSDGQEGYALRDQLDFYEEDPRWIGTSSLPGGRLSENEAARPVAPPANPAESNEKRGATES